MAEQSASGPSGPSVATLKRLFAVSGNQCAFPKCTAPLVVGDKVVGKICHIRAQRPGGPRYNPNMTAEERHAFENLMLMCGTHHDVIDDDEEAYTVERLHGLKAKHEAAASAMSDEQAEAGAQLLLLDQSVSSTNQAGGITAHTVHVHHYAEPRPSDAKAKDAPSDEPTARFRGADDPLGVFWDQVPFSDAPDYEVFLSQGPALWFRLRPVRITSSGEWTHPELLRCAQGPSVPLQPLSWVNMLYLRADDGIGVYATIDNLARETETQSVAFAFSTGGIWSVDTSILRLSGPTPLYFQAIARALIQSLPRYGEFLRCLGYPPPYRWDAGLEGVKGRRLEVPPPPNPPYQCRSGESVPTRYHHGIRIVRRHSTPSPVSATVLCRNVSEMRPDDSSPYRPSDPRQSHALTWWARR